MLALEASLAEAEDTKLIDEITALKEALERQNLSSREEEEEVAEEEEEDPLLVPEVSKKKIDQLRSLSHLVSTLVLKMGSFFGTKPLINY